LKTEVDFFKKNIRSWYKKNNRNFSWRKTNDPWKIYLIEVLSQQTQLDRANKYYNKFILEYPNPEKMALASRRKILKLWSGLGYNNRAIRMHQSSKILSNKPFEELYPDFMELPGVGKYTNSALLSFAYGEKVITVDTNVKRILGRYFKINNIDKFIEKNQKDLLSYFNSRDFNQALMDLGSNVCTNRNPKCNICPLEEQCMKYIREDIQKQEPFENSNRQKRGQIIKILINTKKVTSCELAKKLNIKENSLKELINDLERDGFINISQNKYIEIKS
jgi:A/G-specific adenine glycosylase